MLTYLFLLLIDEYKSLEVKLIYAEIAGRYWYDSSFTLLRQFSFACLLYL